MTFYNLAIQTLLKSTFSNLSMFSAIICNLLQEINTRTSGQVCNTAQMGTSTYNASAQLFQPFPLCPPWYQVINLEPDFSVEVLRPVGWTRVQDLCHQAPPYKWAQFAPFLSWSLSLSINEKLRYLLCFEVRYILLHSLGWVSKSKIQNKYCKNCESIPIKGIVHQFVLYRSNLIFWIVGCGIADFGRRGL